MRRPYHSAPIASVKEGAREMNLHKRRKSESGIFGILGAIALVTILGLSALVVDIGVLLIGRARIAAALDASVLAAAQDLPNTGQAQNKFDEYLAANMPQNGLYSINGTNLTFPGVLNNRIRATATVNANMGFMRVLGMDIGTVGAVAEAQNADPDLALVEDRSGSMCEDSHPGYPDWLGNCPDEPPTWQPMQKVKQASNPFTNQLGSNVQLALVSYSTSATLDVPLTTDFNSVQDAVDLLEPDGYTDIGGAIYTARDELINNGREGAPKAIVLISDGVPNAADGTLYWFSSYPTTYALGAAQNAADNGIIIFSVAYGANADHDLMEDIADITGGQYYNAPDETQLQPILIEIANHDYVKLMPE